MCLLSWKYKKKFATSLRLTRLSLCFRRPAIRPDSHWSTLAQQVCEEEEEVSYFITLKYPSSGVLLVVTRCLCFCRKLAPCSNLWQDVYQPRQGNGECQMVLFYDIVVNLTHLGIINNIACFVTGCVVSGNISNRKHCYITNKVTKYNSASNISSTYVLW